MSTGTCSRLDELASLPAVQRRHVLAAEARELGIHGRGAEGAVRPFVAVHGPR
jgi:hypothetical protein